MLAENVNRFYKRRVFPWLKAMSESDPEIAHEWAMKKMGYLEAAWPLARVIGVITRCHSPLLHQQLGGVDFAHPVCLAAGADKNCLVPNAYAALGFAGIEYGGVTPLMQEGNERPRMERGEGELWNRMGFNNDGAETLFARMSRRWHPLPRIANGLNLGKGKHTRNEHAVFEYCDLMAKFYDLVDYFTINISSPNTAGLRDLQTAQALEVILREAVRCRNDLAKGHNQPLKPIAVKFAPDISNDTLRELLTVCGEEGADYVILANTKMEERGGKVGGRSGIQNFNRALEMVRIASEYSEDRFIVIGCGGINSVDRAWMMLQAGARLIQLYTGLIFEGPFLVPVLVSGIKKRMRERGLKEIREIEGSAMPLSVETAWLFP